MTARGDTGYGASTSHPWDDRSSHSCKKALDIVLLDLKRRRRHRRGFLQQVVVERVGGAVGASREPDELWTALQPRQYCLQQRCKIPIDEHERGSGVIQNVGDLAR